MPSIHVVVQSCKARERTTLPSVLEAVEATDIGADYEVMVDPGEPRRPPRRGQKRSGDSTVRKHLTNVLQRLYDSGADYGLRIEDDVMLNRHVLHNIRTWPALEEDNFGAGWLFVPACVLDDKCRVGEGPKTKTPYREDIQMFGALLVLLPRATLQCILETKPIVLAQDFAISSAVWQMQKRCYFHVPSLAENRVRIPSARGHDNVIDFHCARQLYDADFKRDVTETKKP